MASVLCGKEKRIVCAPNNPVKASIYSHLFDGRKTASGSTYTPKKLTAAHRSLPFGTRLWLHNEKTGKTAVVTVTDRGPYNNRYKLDLSPAAARALGFGFKEGGAWITYKLLGEKDGKEIHRSSHLP